METRKFDKLGIATSLLGFGCMRFPLTKNNKIDEAEATRMLDAAFEAGVTYYDTAYPYHDGQSELFVGKYLDSRPREAYYLATKLPLWEIHSLEDAKAMFEKQLNRLNKEYVDFYLMHAFDRQRFEEMRDLGVMEYFEEVQKSGKIRYLGFSFHDEYQVFEEILNYRDWDFCQIQYNYMDIEEQAGEKGYLLAESKGVPLIIMEPIKGGSLANLPDDIRVILPDQNRSVASYALRFVGSKPNVKVILSGMSTMEQVEDNLLTFGSFEALNREEEDAIVQVRETMNQRVRNGCTACNYCMPCPAGVDIPRNFKIWNAYNIYQNRGELGWQWGNIKTDGKSADLCVKCGLCETKCPQKINIRENLETLRHELTQVLA